MAGLLDLIERLRHPEREDESYNLARERASLGNQGLAQQLQQSSEGFPVNLGIAQENLATQQFNRGRAQTKAPLEDFMNMVSTLGPATGAKAYGASNPQDYTRMFQPAGVPSLDAQGTVPEVAQDAASNFYHLGPETARQLNLAGEMLPINKAQIGMQADAQKDVFQSELPGRIKIAQAGLGASASEHAANRKQQGTSMAMGLLTSSPVMSSVNAVIEAAPQVKDEQTASLLIKQIGALRSQLNVSANMAISVGTALQAGTELPVIVQSTVNNIKQQLDQIHRELYNKYWGGKAKKTSISSVVSNTEFPGGEGGYSP